MSTICAPGHFVAASYSSADLRYRLVTGHVSLAPMIVLGSRTISWGEWIVSFYVLGTSHAMHLSRDGRQLTEILSCVSSPDKQPMIAEFGISDCRRVAVRVHDLSVTIRTTQISLESMKPFDGVLLTNTLEYAYPNPDLDVPSWTRLRWQTTVDSLQLRTQHTYPHEGLCICSETTISDIGNSTLECAQNG